MWKFIVLIIVAVLFLVALIYYNNQLRKETLNYDFNGKVESVIYSDKGEPTVLIKGKEFNLPVNFWNFSHKIEIGDSLVKKKDSMQVILIKSQTAAVIKFH